MSAGEEAALHAAVLARPEADEPRRKLAELLVGRNDPRGEFIQVQLRIAELRRAQGSPAELAGLTPRERGLLASHAAEWTRGLPGASADYRFSRGFPEGIKVAASRFPGLARQLYAKAPILHLELIGAKGTLGDLTATDALARIVSIDLFDQHIADEGVRHLVACPHLGRLAWLNLSYNDITRAGAEALFAPGVFPALRWMGFTSNPAGALCDKVGAYEDDAILDWDSPPLGVELEARHGTRPWLHHQPELSVYYPPEPETFVSGR